MIVAANGLPVTPHMLAASAPQLLVPQDHPTTAVGINKKEYPLNYKQFYLFGPYRRLVTEDYGIGIRGDSYLEGKHAVTTGVSATSRIRTNDFGYSDDPTSLPLTVVIKYVVQLGAANRRTFTTSLNAGGQYCGTWFGANTSSALEVTCGNNSGVSAANRFSFVTSETYTDGQNITVAFSIISTTVARMWVNGVKQTLSTSGTLTSYASGATSGAIGAIYYGTSPAWYNTAERVELAVSAEGALSDQQLYDLSIDPYRLVKPINYQPVYIDYGAAASNAPLYFNHLMKMHNG